jgi:hypothetical protein
VSNVHRDAETFYLVGPNLQRAPRVCGSAMVLTPTGKEYIIDIATGNTVSGAVSPHVDTVAWIIRGAATSISAEDTGRSQ